MLRKSLFVICAMAFLCPGSAVAQDNNWNQRTYFTFSAPVELPGKTLPAGTYLFKIVDSPSNRHVIQVFDKEEKEIYATILAIPAQRRDPSDEPEVRFMEVAANQPPAIRTWWFPGRTIGHEFIYPKGQAARLARAATGTVLTVATDASTTETMREAELARINASAETQVAVTTPPPAESAPTTVPQSTAVTQRQVQTAPAPAITTAPVETTRTELPRTATFLPLLALLGMGSLAGAAALRLRRK